jgi:hypothetical membrane protein
MFGIISPIVAYVSIGISIVFSPWFSWEKNALSDLGHSMRSSVAPLFNLGLLLSGFFMMIYAVQVFRRYSKYSSFFLTVSALFLQLIAVFDEVYGYLHFLVSVVFFLSIGATSLVHAVEHKSLSSLMAFIVGLSSWIIYFFDFYELGISVPEAISSLAVTMILVSSAIKINLNMHN